MEFSSISLGPSAPAIAYCRTHRLRFLEELKEFIRFPSVSAQPEHAEDLKRCAAWLADHLHNIGLERVAVVPTERHPIVYGEWKKAPGRPTLLIYGHYDVQPPEPLNQWHTPPFEPTVIGGYLCGRGASDDKGQMFVHLKALESYLRTTGKLPVNVICLFEGEEEIGSPNFATFIDRYRDAIVTDVAVLSDTRILAPHQPAITYGLRGALSLELEVTGPKLDLHAGNFGGAIRNPLQTLCEIIACLHDGNGRVAIPGFYDKVKPVNMLERSYLAEVAPSDKDILRAAAAKQGWGEPGFSLYERTAIRPALTINGLSGGYQGTGPKAVIPARALAKLNIRLVPDQNPNEIEYLFRRYIVRISPPAVRLAIRRHLGSEPTETVHYHPAMQAAKSAYRIGFGAEPVFLRSGGTIPAVSLFQERLGIATLLMGFALPDDGMHAPNEKFYLPNFFNGITTCICFLAALAEQADSYADINLQAFYHNDLSPNAKERSR